VEPQKEKAVALPKFMVVGKSSSGKIFVQKCKIWSCKIQFGAK